MPFAQSVGQIPPPEQIRETARAILERGEFAEPSRWHEIVMEALLAIKRWLDSLSAWTEAHPVLARVVFIIALIVLLACLAHLFYLALADVLPFSRQKERARARSARWDILEGSAKNWRDALQIARTMLQEGNLRRAVWIAHRVLLGLLDEKGAIKFAGWKTNSHYLAECAPSHPWRATFAELTELYDSTVYADRSAPSDAPELLVGRVDQFCRERGGAG